MDHKRNLAPRTKGHFVKVSFEDHPMVSLHKAVNQLFNDFYMSFEMMHLTEFEDICTYSPRIDMSDDGRQITIKAELPGMERDAIEVCVDPDCLTIKGSKKNDNVRTEEASDYCTERIFGNFKRAIPIPQGMDANRTSATYRNGILTITIPRRKGYKNTRRIEIKNGT